MRRVDVLVVGAGPAGIGAAAEVTRHGLDTMLVDSRPQGGGLYFARPPSPNWSSDLPPALVEGLDLSRIQVRVSTQVWGIFPERVFALAGEETDLVSAGAVVIATGAIEAPVPFPGWELPGVVAAGAVQLVLKASNAVPAGRIVVAGTGPFLLAVAAQLSRAGAQVTAVVEAAPLRNQLPILAALMWRPGRMREAARYLTELRRVRLLRGRRIHSATHGELRLVGGERLAFDTLCVGHGFRPRLELAGLLGCKLAEGVLAVDDDQATSVPGVYGAGEVTGIGGAELAHCEGRLAGLAIADAAGRLATADRARRSDWRRRRHAAAQFAATLRSSYPDLLPLALATDDTTICRCEGITLGSMREVAKHSPTGDEARSLKALLRCGMGPCQGAMCWEAVEAIVPRPHASAGRPRLPLGVVTVGALARAEELGHRSKGIKTGE